MLQPFYVNGVQLREVIKANKQKVYKQYNRKDNRKSLNTNMPLNNEQ